NQLGLNFCTLPAYWAQHVPSMFCFKVATACAPGVHGNPVQQLTNVLTEVPKLVNALLKRAEHIVCVDAKHPQQCLKRKTLLIKCAKSRHAEKCLEKHAIVLTCLKKHPGDVKRCVAADKQADLTKLV